MNQSFEKDIKNTETINGTAAKTKVMTRSKMVADGWNLGGRSNAKAAIGAMAFTMTIGTTTATSMIDKQTIDYNMMDKHDEICYTMMQLIMIMIVTIMMYSWQDVDRRRK